MRLCLPMYSEETACVGDMSGYIVVRVVIVVKFFDMF